MPSDQPPQSVSEFLDRTLAVSVLLEIGTGAKRFSDHEDSLDLSSATLTERLREGETLGLWEKQLSRRGLSDPIPPDRERRTGNGRNA